MVHGRIWPAHPKPLPDELLSSWIVRVAQANGIKLQTLCWMLFGNERSPWNRDIDRSAPKWLLKAMCEHTGTSYWEAYHTTLTTFRTILYPSRRRSGQLRWILPVRTYAMTRKGYGQQFCPQCLAEDQMPYFRKAWRVALFTFCPTHWITLHDSCPSCGAPVIFHRGDFGVELEKAGNVCSCYSCGTDFRKAAKMEAVFPNEEIRILFRAILRCLEEDRNGREHFDLGFFSVLHQFCRIMGSRQNAGLLRMFIAAQLGVEKAEMQFCRTPVEHRRIAERHDLLSSAVWLMAKPTERISHAWEAKAVRYNLLLKDMVELPIWYRQLVRAFSTRRQRQMHDAAMPAPRSSI